MSCVQSRLPVFEHLNSNGSRISCRLLSVWVYFLCLCLNYTESLKYPSNSGCHVARLKDEFYSWPVSRNSAFSVCWKSVFELSVEITFYLKTGLDVRTDAAIFCNREG